MSLDSHSGIGLDKEYAGLDIGNILESLDLQRNKLTSRPGSMMGTHSGRGTLLAVE